MPDRTIWFVRHGESLSNTGGTSMPHHVIPLTEKGHAQAAALVAALPSPACVLVSALHRTADTAKPYCARHALSPQTDALLNEFDMLPFDMISGMDGAGRRVLSEAYWSAPDPDRRMGAETESFRDFSARVGAFVEKLRQLPDRTVIFGHGTWLGLMLWQLGGGQSDTGAGMTAFRKAQQAEPVQNAEILRVQREGQSWRVARNTLAAVFALALASCASAPDASGYRTVDCSGWFEDWSDCVAAADDLCFDNGGYVARWDKNAKEKNMRVRCAGT